MYGLARTSLIQVPTKSFRKPIETVMCSFIFLLDLEQVPSVLLLLPPVVVETVVLLEPPVEPKNMFGHCWWLPIALAEQEA